MKGNTLIAVYEEAGRYSWSLIKLMFEIVFHVNTLLQKSIIIKATAYGTKSARLCCYIDSGRRDEQVRLSLRPSTAPWVSFLQRGLGTESQERAAWLLLFLINRLSVRKIYLRC